MTKTTAFSARSRRTPRGPIPSAPRSSGGTLTITGSRNSDNVQVELEKKGHTQQIVVVAGGQIVGSFDPAAVTIIQFKGYAGNDSIVISPHLPSRPFSTAAPATTSCLAAAVTTFFLAVPTTMSLSVAAAVKY